MGYVQGTVEKYLFHNEEDAYSVIMISITDTDEQALLYFKPTIVIRGFFPRLDIHAEYRFHGEVKEHEKYGIQYEASRFERIVDMTKDGIIDYLASDLFKGVGPKTAEKIVDELGTDALDKIVENKDVLDDIPRMTEEKKTMIQDVLLENRQMESSLVWLYGFDISPRMAMRIYDTYGNDSKTILSENPYQLIEDVDGIGFKRADEIGLKIGFSFDDPLRIRAVVYFLLNEYMNRYGDTYLAYDRLFDYTMRYLNNDQDMYVSEDDVRDVIRRLNEDGKVILEDDRIALYYVHLTEKRLAGDLMRINEEADRAFDESEVKAYLADFEQTMPFSYTEEQKEAILIALREPFSVITGGPGTGKTTIIDGIVHVFYTMHEHMDHILDKIILCAPTGKAAKRLQEATDMPTSTIHRLLGYDYQGIYKKDEHDPLDVKLLVVDEASMMDVFLASRLFRAVKSGVKIVIVGDHNQLPSVGPGQFLYDIIASDLFNVVTLSHVHRQAKGSTIVSLAYNVLSGEMERMPSKTDEFSFIGATGLKVADIILRTLNRAMTVGYDLKKDVQVLIPIYKGVAGIDRINAMIQSKFNAKNKDFSISFGEKTFYLYDKVLQLVNQPEDDVMNGDIGIITEILENKEISVDFSGNVVRYDRKDLDNLSLAYALSIHKSQGSEFSIVVMPVMKSYAIMLRKNLLYTAITRAKEKLVVIGEEEAFLMGIHRDDSGRKTRLVEFLQDVVERSSDEQQVTIEDFM